MNLEIVQSMLNELGLTQAAIVLDSRAEQAVKLTGSISSLPKSFLLKSWQPKKLAH